MKPILLLALTAITLAAQSSPRQAAAEKEILDLETKYNGAYAANDLPTYFSYLASDFNQWLPSGRTDKEAYQKSWTRFIQNGGKVVSADFFANDHSGCARCGFRRRQLLTARGHSLHARR